MNLSIRHLLFLLFVFLFFALIPTGFLCAKTGDAPTIVSVELQGGEYLNRPLVKGLTPPNTEVMIYVDGIYMGNAHVNEENTSANNFYFQPVQPIDPGMHTVSAAAKDKTALTLSPFSNEIVFNTNHLLPAPTLVEPNEDTVTGKVKPLIKGLACDHTFVHVYIDGVYNGKTPILKHKSGTADFAYKPFLNLEPGGHTAWAMAEDLAGKKSQSSNVLYFTIEDPLPAPVLYDPVANSNTDPNQPFIVGLAKNDLDINVYIDRTLNGSFKVNNNELGTANFAFKPFLPLNPGNHLVYATAKDARGKESIWSNLIYFNISQPTITPIAAEEEPVKESDLPPTSPEPDLIPGKIAPDQVDTGEGQESAAPETDAVEGLEDILGQPEPEAEETGAINESKEKQGKLELNLIIFILFLIAIVVWIFWVNRELIKERREQADEKDNEDSKEKAAENDDKNPPKFDI